MKKVIFTLALCISMVAFVSCENFGAGSGKSEAVDTTETVVDSVTVAKDSLVQCKGITKRGTQCERMLWWPDTLCFQHKGQALPNEN
jgi:hypothetical protein